MKKLIIAFCLVLPLAVQADLLTDILDGKYKPKTLSSHETDSILMRDTAGRYTLEYENEQHLYRRSFIADWYVVDREKNKRTLLGGGQVRDPQLSPNGKYVAFAKGNNLYLHKLDFGTEVAVTTDLNPHILNGVTDWLYEEEFSTTAVFAFSPDSKQLAFLRLDETHVPTFSWQHYIGSDSAYLSYPAIDSIRYPKAGMTNPIASVCVYDIQYKSIKTMQTNADDNDYCPRLSWTNRIQNGKDVREGELAILRLNRDQTVFEVLLANPKSTVCRTFYKEESQTGWVDYAQFDEWQWLSDNRCLVVSEQSGWRQAYLYDQQGLRIRQLTTDGVDVTAVYGIDEANNTLFYQSAVTPMTRQCFAFNFKKNVLTPLTAEDGMHRLTFNLNYTQFIDNFENISTPNQYTLYRYTNGKVQKVRVVRENAELADLYASLGLNPKEFFTFKTERGDELNGWMIRPSNFQSTKRYPVVMLQYSGPGSQRVLNNWRKNWEHYLAQQGYLVVCVDPRGTAGRGTKFLHETYMELGKKEAEDLISAAHYLSQLSYVDKEHIALGGWSYGGFQTLMTMSQPKSPFCCGFAIAPVTSWRLYDSAYTERYMRRPQVNDYGYSDNDLRRMADNLQGDLLIVHGLADDNVHVQNSLQYIDALVQAGKQFDMQLYVDDNHHLRQRANYEHLHRRLMRFLENSNK